MIGSKSELSADWTVVVADDEQFIRTIVVRILRYRLADLNPGQVLAQDITTPGGDCLLGAGVTLTERYLRRLGELAAVLNLDVVAVYAPSKVESKA